MEVIDWTGEENLVKIQRRIDELAARNPGRFAIATGSTAPAVTDEEFVSIRPGGQREPLVYDPKGYFVITLDRGNQEIVLRHYSKDHRPAHEMRGRGATSMLLGLLREGLVTQLSHAGYLGEELSKAQTALQFGLRYAQDRPLCQQDGSAKSQWEQGPGSKNEASTPASGQRESPKPLPEPMTLKQFEDAAIGSAVDFGFTVTDLPGQELLGGVFLAMDEAEPFTAYYLTDYRIEARWNPPTTRIIMGQASEVVVGALLRIYGRRRHGHSVNVEQIIVLSRVPRIVS